MEHHELVMEMAYIEKLSTQERLKLARRRRMQQLKKYSQREKEGTQSKKEKTAQNEAKKISEYTAGVKNSRVFFNSSVMILEAAARNDIDEVKSLLENGVDPDSTNEDGLTALHQCCIDDSEEMMRVLVYYGANVNAQDSEKWTPLHAAATCGHLHLAKFLISKGGNLLAVNADGNMPYDICEDDTTLDYIENEMAARGVTQQLIDDTRATVERKMLAELKKMKLEGQSLMCRDEYGATPLHVAAANGYIGVVEYLITQNIPIEVQDNDDWSPLHAAACWGHPDVVELLVQHGANLQAKTKNQETPYDICEDVELRERISQLINEQETKRLHDQHKRIRRVRSNKRTQSIRRTSVREKILTPKKDAQEEVRIRMQRDNKYFSNNMNISNKSISNKNLEDALPPNIIENSDADDDKEINIRPKGLEELEKNKELICNQNTTNGNSFSNNGDGISKYEDKSSLRKEIDYRVPLPPDVSLQSGYTAPPVNRVEVSLSSGDVKGIQPPVPPPRSSSTMLSSALGAPLTSDGAEAGSNNKIDIHVTVTVNPFSPGTLQDLKRQRALSRASQGSLSLSSATGQNMFSLNASQNDDISQQSDALGVSSSVEVPPVVSLTSHPSPIQTPRRFCGQPSDVIGKERVPCCGLM